MYLPKQTQDYSIVLLPTAEVRNLAIATSANLSQPPKKTFFSLGEQYIPHTTLTMARFLAADQAVIKKALRDIAHMTVPLDLNAELYGGGARFINITYTRTPALTHLQQRVLHAINALRSGLPSEQADLLRTTADPEVKQNLEAFGFQAIGDRWKPHMTLTRFREQADRSSVDAAKLPPPSDFDDTSNELALCIMGRHGTVTAISARFVLRGDIM